MNPWIIAAGLSLVPIALCVFLYVQLRRIQTRLDVVTSGIGNKDLVQIVREYLAALSAFKNDSDEIRRELEKIRTETATFFRKVGLVRYQAFKNTGGDQSFSLAILDDTNSGVVISSLYGRDYSKTYAKRIEKGEPSHPLTDEEKKALLEARTS